MDLCQPQLQKFLLSLCKKSEEIQKFLLSLCKKSEENKEQKNDVWLPVLAAGAGLGVALGLSTRLGGIRNSNGEEELWNEQVKQELTRQVIDGKECEETFQDFPFCLSERSWELLMSTALKQLIFSRNIRDLRPIRRAIIISGPTELYLRSLAKALAHHFESKLLLLDIDVSFKSSKRSSSEVTPESLSSFGETEDPLKNKSDTRIDEELFMESLYKVLVSVSEKSSIILYIRDVDKTFLKSEKLYNSYREILEKLSGPVLILGSQITDVEDKCLEDERLAALFPYNIKIKPPKDLCHSLDQSNIVKDTRKLETDGKKEVPSYDRYEANMKSELIPANEIGVTFSDIGALEKIKRSLQELIMLPLRRPELFKGGLLKPCRGILLFGPPGTGKTMLAKAIAHEAGASFINVPMSAITSRWLGEGEKNVRALFKLAAKVAPTIIFIDEVDSLLGQRARCEEHEAMRKIKNEFMTYWDGLSTKQDDRILVLAATNRPFDLDDAIIRRFERRIMVGLPSVETREIILKTILAKGNTEKLDIKGLAIMTEGYTGSDLKNLCTAAAYQPVRELLKQERLKDMEKNIKGAKGQSLEAASSTKENTNNKGKKDAKGQSSKAASSAKEDKDPVITLRPINMKDMIQAKNQVPASFDANGLIMHELQQWNELYGERSLR